MKITIITVTYNSAEFLKYCISSVLNQTYSDIEYIIVDGASIDNTIEIIKSFKTIKYVSEPDRGIYDAINKGIKMATGEVIGILNSDDFFADENVVSRIAHQFKLGSFDALYSDIQFVDREIPTTVVRYYSSKFFKPFLFKFGFQPAHPTFYVRKKILDKYGFYRTDLTIAGDFELLLRLIYLHKISYKYVDDLWVKMRVGGISTSGVNSVIKLNNQIVISCRLNNVYTNKLMVYSKYFFKWWGFINKRNSI